MARRPTTYGDEYEDGYIDPGDRPIDDSPTWDDPYGSGPGAQGPMGDPPGQPTPTPAPAPTPIPFSQQALAAILRKYPPTPDGRMQGLAEANKTFGLNLTWFGSKGDKIRMPDGRVLDFVIGSGTNNPQWSDGHEDSGAPAGPAGGGGGDFPIDPSYLDPWTGKPPERPAADPFVGPGDFVQPTGDSILQDPSYLFRRDQGAGALENSAAAKGLLGSSGTLRDILEFGQKSASQEYGSIWDRAFGAWNAKWGNALNTYRTNQDTKASDYDRAWQQYLDAKDTWYKNQDKPFDKLAWAAGMGSGAAR